jgi:hypothetical protein
MTVSSESYTTNSIKITVSNETTPANIISAVDTAITSLGWSQYDYIAPNSSTVFTTATSTTGTITPTGGFSSLTTFGTPTGTSSTSAGTYTSGIASTSGVGSGGYITVTKTGSGTTYSGVTTATMYLSGTGYVVGNTIVIAGANLGGTTPTNNLTLTIGGSVLTNTINGYVSSSAVSGTSVTAANNYIVTPLSTSGSGTGAVFQIIKTGAGTAYSGFTTIVVLSSGTGYAVGDTIVIAGANLGGTTPTNNLTITVGAVKSNYQNTAVITGMSSTTGFGAGSLIAATAGTGTLYGGTPDSIVVNNIVSSSSITYTINNGTPPTSGTVTNIVQSNLNTWSPLYTYVYRAICADNTNYKYLIIRWDPTKQQFFTAAAEGWDTSTKQPLNGTYGFNGTFGQGYDLKDCQILVSATSSHFMIWPWVRQSMGLWTAIFEFERVAVEDSAAAGMPNFAWTNSVILGYTSDNSSYQFVFPRLPNSSLNKDMRAVTNKGITTTLGDSYNYTYGWDITKSVITSFSIDHATNLQPQGRAYNCSITKPFGAGLDTTTVPLAPGGWADTSGTNSTCLILPLNGGAESGVYSSLNTVNASGRPQNNGYSAAGVVDMLLIGVNAWCACGSGGIKTYDTTQTVSSGTLVQRLAGNYDKLIFDGFRTIYAIYVNAGSGGTTLARIDTETYNSATITLAYAAHQIAIDGQYVYVGINGASTSPRVAIINRWTTTDGSTGSGFTLASTYASGVTGSYIANIFPDYRGCIYITYTYHSTFNLTISASSQYGSAGTGAIGIDKVSVSGIPTRGRLGASYSLPPLTSQNYPVHAIAFYYDPISNYLMSIISHTNNNISVAKFNSYSLYHNIYVHSYSNNTLSYTTLTTYSYTSGLSSTSLAADTVAGLTGFQGSSSSSTLTYGILQSIFPYNGTLVMSMGTYLNNGSSNPFNLTYTLADIIYGVTNLQTNPVVTSYVTNTQALSGNYSLSTAANTLFNNYQYRSMYTNGTVALRNINGNIYYLNNLYNMNKTDGTASGRLILKG